MNETEKIHLKQILSTAIEMRVIYSVQYVDYPESWTVPCKLTLDRMDKLLSDVSVSKIKLEFEM